MSRWVGPRTIFHLSNEAKLVLSAKDLQNTRTYRHTIYVLFSAASFLSLDALIPRCIRKVLFTNEPGYPGNELIYQSKIACPQKGEEVFGRPVCAAPQANPTLERTAATYFSGVGTKRLVLDIPDNLET